MKKRDIKKLERENRIKNNRSRLKVIKLLRFYKKQDEEVSFKLIGNPNMLIIGKLEKVWSLCDPFCIIRISDKKVMKIYIDDIEHYTLFPGNSSKCQGIEFINQGILNIRKSIPKSLKIELWKNNFGEMFEGSCYVCKSKILRDEFEAGHVIASINGGEDKIDNLRTICKACNRSMGTQNLNKFKEKYF